MEEDPLGPFALCGKRLGYCDDPLHHQKICPDCIEAIRKGEEEYEKESSETHLILYPKLHKELRAIPNSIARSALFKVADKRAPRGYINLKMAQPVAALKGIKITYSGPELRQSDEDVMLELLRICNDAKSIDGVRFVARRVLVAIKLDDQKRNYDRLKLSMSYLKNGNLTIETENVGFSGSLIRKFTWRDKQKKKDSSAREYRVWLEPEIARLFKFWTSIDFTQRLRLRSSLARAIHTHMSTHDNPYPYSVRLWRTLSGSSIKTLKHFRAELKKALEELVKVGFLKAWRIDDTDLVHVDRADPRKLELPSGEEKSG